MNFRRERSGQRCRTSDKASAPISAWSCPETVNLENAPERPRGRAKGSGVASVGRATVRASGPDVKAEALLDRIQQQQREENAPNLKVLIFTEFVPTRALLADFLGRRGFTVAVLNGGMDLSERDKPSDEYSDDAQILISTDAGGEGLNLQFCHMIVNYDLPWNPMKIEQRIGRVDRVGQKHIVRAFNFALADAALVRYHEVLEEKLATILDEFGVDKLADVLDSEDGGVPFEALFAQAMLTQEDAERRAAGVADDIRRRAEEARASSRLLNATETLDPATAQRIAQPSDALLDGT